MRKFLLVFSLVCIVGCSTASPVVGGEDELNYSDNRLWYHNGKSIDKSLADVFYVLPTCVFDWKDSIGEVHHYADPYNESQRSSMDYSYKLADEIFADSCNYFAPYYRQITLDAWGEGEKAVETYLPKAMDDVRKAFDYYMEHWNEGRPFVIAGFSQGGRGVVELLKHLTSEQSRRLVAAYVCGYRVTAADTSECKAIRPAKDESSTGVTVSYNTVASESGIMSVITDGTVCCINPVNWRTDEVKAPFIDGSTIRVDKRHNVLLVEGLDAEKYTIPSIAHYFPKGNLHLMELEFYKQQLKHNVKVRAYGVK